LRQIRAAKIAKADAVKFQMFTHRELFDRPGKEWGLPRGLVSYIHDFCHSVDIEFMCTAFSVDGYEFIDQYVKHHKIASPEACANDIKAWAHKQKKPVLWSNGCAGGLSELEPFIPLACVSKYPADFLEYDVSSLTHLEKWGISDHTLDSRLAVFARSRGASYFEKHVDFLPHLGSGPDTCVSIDGDSFADYVSVIHKQEKINFGENALVARSKYGRRLTDAGWFRP
jgi:sialic acid synthase SpsE